MWNEIEDLVNIGAYAAGSNPAYDAVIQTRGEVDEYLQQGIDERAVFDDSRTRLIALAKRIEQAAGRGDRANAKKAPTKQPATT